MAQNGLVIRFELGIAWWLFSVYVPLAILWASLGLPIGEWICRPIRWAIRVRSIS